MGTQLLSTSEKGFRRSIRQDCGAITQKTLKMHLTPTAVTHDKNQHQQMSYSRNQRDKRLLVIILTMSWAIMQSPLKSIHCPKSTKGWQMKKPGGACPKLVDQE